MPGTASPYRRLRQTLLLLGVCLPSAFTQIPQQPPRFEHYFQEDGLSQNAIMCSLLDRDGYLWFGTQDGLNRFDGYQFTQFLEDSENPDGINDQFINTLFQDQAGHIWVGTAQGGANRYDPTTGRFTHFVHDPMRSNSLSDNQVMSILEDNDGRMWFGSFGTGVDLQMGNEDAFHNFSFLQPDAEDLSENMITDLILDRAGRLWVATMGTGVFRIDPETTRITRFEVGAAGSGVRCLLLSQEGFIWVGDEKGLGRLDPTTGSWSKQRLDGRLNEVRDIHQTSDGILWLATYNRGLVVLNPKTGESVNYDHRPLDPDSLTTQALTNIVKDASNTWWFGTFGGGICKWSADTAHFAHYHHEPLNPHSLSHNFIRAIHEDHLGQIWLATSGGGISILDPETGLFTRLDADPATPGALAHDTVHDVSQGPDHDYWIGTSAGLHRINSTTGALTHYPCIPEDPTTLRSNFALNTVVDTDGRAWIATWGGGLSHLDPQTNCMDHLRHDPEQADSLPNDRLSQILLDPKGRLWVASESGISLLHRDTKTFLTYRHDPKNPDTIGHERVFGFSLDFRNPDRLWLGTGNGVSLLDTVTGKAQTWRVRDGLPNRVVYGVLADPPDRVWMSTNNGLAVMDLNTQEFRSYHAGDGLQMDEFNQNAFMRASSGRLYFGGLNGFNAFNPRQIRDNPVKPSVRITGFRIFNVPVSINDPGSPLTAPIDHLSSLVLDHTQNMFSFEFAALHFARPEQNRYAYKMEGLDDTWIPTSADNRRAAYTTLPAGEYLFRVKAANKDGLWSDHEASIKVHILPPPWRSWWAWSLYVILAAALIIWYLSLQREKLEQQRQIAEKDRRLAEEERKTADRLRQIDKLKDDFLANTSHELRTPLNGIIGLAESLIDGATGPLPESTKANLAMVASCGRRLSNLVNDILDFSKLRNKNLDLHHTAIDFRALTDVVLALSRPLVGGKPVTLNNRVSSNLPPVWADENRLQQIMHNLIGNAVKFTQNGYVTVAGEVLDGRAAISVIDSGCGIPPDKLDLIFESFEQVDGSMVRNHSGTGLGLAVTRQLVELHGGTIEVRSVLGEGSTFTFFLPLSDEPATPQAAGQAPARLIQARDQHRETTVGPEVSDRETGKSFKILVVDDEPVNRQVLVNHLTLRRYTVREAVDGNEALSILKSGEIFDMVLLDVMMPGMSGYEVCEMLRKEFPVQDLPVIILTAKNGVTDMIGGFSAGANDFLTKPVTKDELLARVRLHLELLDINRNLEEKVEARTREIKSKNEEILTAQRRLMVQDKLVSLGRISAGIAHELVNPLNFVSNFAQASHSLLEDLADLPNRHDVHLSPEVKTEFEELLADLRQNGRATDENSKRAVQIVKRMMALSETREQSRSRTDLNNLVTEYTRIACSGAREKSGLPNLEFIVDTDPKVGEVWVSQQSLTRVLVNLVNNAVESMAAKDWTQGGAPTLQVRTRRAGNWAEIDIQDNGIGMAADQQDAVFKPFFTTKPPGAGNIGLGLTICFDIVTAEHGGELNISSIPNEGALFQIRLPLDGSNHNT